MLRRRLALAVVAALLVAGGLWRAQRRPDALLAQLAAGPTRPLEARLASPALDRRRPFAPGGTLPMTMLADLEARGNRRLLAEAQLIAGRADDAERSLARAARDHDNHDDADVAVDRAAVALARGEPDAALRAADAALERTPVGNRRRPAASEVPPVDNRRRPAASEVPPVDNRRRPAASEVPAGRAAAAWNRALALVALELPLAAATSFDAVAQAGEPGWADEARVRARALRDEVARRKAGFAAADAAGLALALDGTLLPPAIVRDYGAISRSWLYDAVRAAPSAERVRALRPLATALDEQAERPVLAAYVDAVAGRRFDRRAPLALGYAAALRRAPSGAAAEAWLATLTRAGADADDILLGAYYLCNRQMEHLPDYLRLAQASGDPWYAVLALQFSAAAESARGDLAAVERDLQRAIDVAGARGLEFRWLRVAFQWSQQLVVQTRLRQAELLARQGLRRARHDDFSYERGFVLGLVELAVRRGDDSLVNAYLDESVQRADQRCFAERHADETKASLAHTELRFDEARRLLAAVPTCEEPRLSITGAALAADLQRVDASPIDRSTLEATLAQLAGNPYIGAAEKAHLEVIRGRALAHFDRPAAEQLLQHARRAAEALPRSDLYGRGARGNAFSELAFIAAADGRWDDTIAAVAGHLEVSAPERCTLAVALDDERMLVAARDEAGRSVGRLARRRTVMPAPAELVPAELRRRLAGCAELHVLALPPLNGRPDLLPPELAWSYGAGAPPPAVTRAPPAAAPPRRLVVADVSPPPSLGLPALQPYSAPAGRADRILRGVDATPARVLAELPNADEIELDVHGFIDLGVSDASMLVLSADSQGRWALTATDLKKLHLSRAPLVILGACNAAQPAPSLHDAWSLPQAFVAAGARAVFGSAAPVPDVESARFFDDLQSRIHAGSQPAVALRDARLEALRGAHDWVRDVMLFQ
jgi:hypothetical protein